ncbi:unnamed protein product [Orchesella dallaii]|uniref:RGS domain-containing protein n=1 Tax=Orchesella dallaii TaxID=48710 RepID=A0ABP1Q7F1_9HEXA
MTKEREMGQRAQKGVEEGSRSKSGTKSSHETSRINAGDLEASETLSSSGKKVFGRGKNNGSPEGKSGAISATSKGGPADDVSRSVNGHQAQQNSRPKCRCWCCCCSCSCSALKNNEPKKEATESDPVCDGDPVPSLEEIRSWGESFDKLMRSPGGRKVFRDFLKCEYSEENILFWLACEELKKESRPETIEEKARLIYEDIHPLSERGELGFPSSRNSESKHGGPQPAHL